MGLSYNASYQTFQWQSNDKHTKHTSNACLSKKCLRLLSQKEAHQTSAVRLAGQKDVLVWSTPARSKKSMSRNGLLLYLPFTVIFQMCSTKVSSTSACLGLLESSELFGICGLSCLGGPIRYATYASKSTALQCNADNAVCCVVHGIGFDYTYQDLPSAASTRYCVRRISRQKGKTKPTNSHQWR